MDENAGRPPEVVVIGRTRRPATRARSTSASRAESAELPQDRLEMIARRVEADAQRAGDVSDAPPRDFSLELLGAIGALSAAYNLLMYGVAPFVTDHVVAASFTAMLCLYFLLAIVPGLAGALLLARHPSARAWIVCAALLTLSGIVMSPGGYVEAWRELQAASGLFRAWRPAFSLASIVIWTLAFLLVTVRGQSWLGETTLRQWVFAAGTIGVIYGSLLALRPFA